MQQPFCPLHRDDLFCLSSKVKINTYHSSTMEKTVFISKFLNLDTNSQYPLYGGNPTTYHVHVYYRIDSTVSHLTMNTEGKRLELRMFHMKIHI